MRKADHQRVRTVLAGLGGIAPARDLAAAGVGATELRAAVFDHAVLRFRKGWYTLFELPDSVIHASRVGGVLACVSAARHHGLWVPEDARLHVAVPSHASRLRSPRDHRIRLDADTVVHWVSGPSAPYEHVSSIVDAIRLVCFCKGAVAAFTVLESALRKQRISSAEHAALVASIPADARGLLSLAGHLSDSGTESLLALLLRGIGAQFRQQVSIPTVGLVDFVVGDRLIIEADSLAHHSDPTRDRRRDAAASALGYRTLRFMYSQVVHEQDAVRRAIVAAITRDDHLP